MEPFFIDNSLHKIYAIYHTPEKFRNDSVGIVCCPPFGHEYIRSHKSYAKLAQRLADIGHHVIRFDFLGCGNSSGDLSNVTFKDWLENIGQVIDEFRQVALVDTIYLYGIRLGASLAIEYSKLSFVNGLILICPVLKGEDYLTQLTNNHKKWLEGSFCNTKDSSRSELLGFHYSDSLLKELSQIRLDLGQLNQKTRLFLIDRPDSLPSTLDVGNSVDIKSSPIINEGFWEKNSDQVSKLVPTEEINILAGWLN